MKLSTRARYGLRICFILGLESDIISLTTLTKRTNLSEKYIEQLLSMLKRAGIVQAKRGSSGGYMLTDTPKNISIDRILTALKDNFDISDCALGGCDDIYCPNRNLFTRLHRNINAVLVSTSLQDLIEDSSCHHHQ